MLFNEFMEKVDSFIVKNAFIDGLTQFHRVDWNIEECEGATNWKIIECIYTWHPIFDGPNPKGKIAALFAIGGMPLMRELWRTAIRMQDADREARSAERKAVIAKDLFECAKQRVEDLRKEVIGCDEDDL